MKSLLLLFQALIFLVGSSQAANLKNDQIKLIYDTDVNNELDDQHALGYLLF